LKYLWISILFFSLSAQATTFEAYSHTREGLKKFEKKSYYPAYKDFTSALESDPMNPGVHLNIARTFEASEDWDKAEQAYRGALKILPENSDLRFEALFNMAGVQVKQKKIDEALSTYQAALEMNPESHEVKTNIELLWQGGGGGGGEGESKENDKDQQGQQQQPKEDQGQQKDKKPQKFQSQNLSPEDVKKILDEIKNQEQGIRAQEYDKGAKDAPRGKDW
jgi:Ca-activated chloride channel homolog